MKSKLLKNIFLVLMIILFAGFAMASEGHEEIREVSEATSERDFNIHISIMFILMILLMVVIYLSFKCWDIFEKKEISFSFRFITVGLIILAMNQVLHTSSHFGIIIFDNLLKHIIDIIGYFILGLGLYFIVKNKDTL